MTYITGFGESAKQALRSLVEVSVDTGVADDTSAVDHLDDAAKSWPVDGFSNLIVEITGGTGEGQIRKLASNTATRLVPVTNFDTAPDSTSTYRIGFFGKIASDITAWGGTALTGRDISLDLANLDVALTILAKLERWQRDIDVAWVHSAEQAAPGAGAALVTKAVTAGKTGYIYGFLISAQEANDFQINWTSGGAAYSKRIIFGGMGSTQCVDPVALNEGLGADAETNVTITNVNAAAAGKIYQANLLYGEV